MRKAVHFSLRQSIFSKLLIALLGEHDMECLLWVQTLFIPAVLYAISYYTELWLWWHLTVWQITINHLLCMGWLSRNSHSPALQPTSPTNDVCQAYVNRHWLHPIQNKVFIFLLLRYAKWVLHYWPFIRRIHWAPVEVEKNPWHDVITGLYLLQPVAALSEPLAMHCVTT